MSKSRTPKDMEIVDEAFKTMGKVVATTVAMNVLGWERRGIVTEDEAREVARRFERALSVPVEYPPVIKPGVRPLALPGALLERERAAARRKKSSDH